MDENRMETNSVEQGGEDGFGVVGEFVGELRLELLVLVHHLFEGHGFDLLDGGFAHLVAQTRGERHDFILVGDRVVRFVNDFWLGQSDLQRVVPDKLQVGFFEFVEVDAVADGHIHGDHAEPLAEFPLGGVQRSDL